MRGVSWGVGGFVFGLGGREFSPKWDWGGRAGGKARARARYISVHSLHRRREARGAEGARSVKLGRTTASDPPFAKMSGRSARSSSSTFLGVGWFGENSVF